MQARQVYMLVSLLQVDALEEDALEMLGLVWSPKDCFVPINWIPPEIFSLILEYWNKHDVEKT